MNNIKCTLKGECNHRNNGRCTLEEPCHYQSIDIQNPSSLPTDLQEAINTFGRYGVVIQVSNDRVFLKGNGVVSYKPFIRGRCVERSKTGIACDVKCDNCKLWDEEKSM